MSQFKPQAENVLNFAFCSFKIFFKSANHNHYRSLLAVFKVNSLTVITKYYYFISFEFLLFRLSSSVYCFYYRKCAHSHTEKKKTRENRSPNKHFLFFFPFQLLNEKMPLLAWLLEKQNELTTDFTLVKLHLPQSVVQGRFYKICHKLRVRYSTVVTMPY